jgi:hypothetical protein
MFLLFGHRFLHSVSGPVLAGFTVQHHPDATTTAIESHSHLALYL